jgi:small-conductance mechanosensitive channel
MALPETPATRRTLDDLAANLAEWGSQVDVWTAELQTRTALLDSAHHQLVEARQLWEGTLRRAGAEAADSAVMAQAAEVLGQIVIQDSAVGHQLQELVPLEVSLTKAALAANAGHAAVDEAKAHYRRQLLRLDDGPVWRLRADSLAPLGEVVSEHVGLSLGALAEPLMIERGWGGRFLLFISLVTGLFLTLLALRRKSGWPDAAEAGQIARDERWLLQHPAASVWLMALLGLAAVFPRAPSATYDLILLAAAIPLWRVTPTLLPPELRRAGRWAILLFAADRLSAVLLHSTAWHRLAILLVGMLALGLGTTALRRLATMDVTRGAVLPRWGLRGARLGIGVAGAALLANLVGNVTLALVLTTGVAELPFLGILLYAGANVLDGVVALGFRAIRHDFRFVEEHGPAIARRVTQVVHVGAAIAWIGLALSFFSLWEPTRSLVVSFLGASWSLGATQFSLASVGLFFLTVGAGVVLGRWLAILLEVDLLDRLDLPRGVPATIASIVRYALTAIAFFLGLAAAGVAVSQLAIIGGALSVGVGFGLQTIVNNFVSGLILVFERPLAIGDSVEIGGLAGQVRSIGIRASIIRTAQGADVIVANGRLLSDDVVNWTRNDRLRRLEIPVGVAYGTKPKAVMALLNGVAAADDRVLATPAPLCVFDRLGESSLDFVLRFWTKAEDHGVVRSDVQAEVYEALDRAGIEIPFPQRDIHLHPPPGVAAPGTTPAAVG